MKPQAIELAAGAGLRIGSLFSGLGGFELGAILAGLPHTVAWQAEVDPYCAAVLARHWPKVPNLGDVRRIHAPPLVDAICGGFPCQDVSGAGRGAGLADGTRSGLWYEFRRIVGEVRPRFVLVENVASGKGRWLCEVRSDLHALGYGTRAFSISAADVGAPHLRRRIFVVADAHGSGSRSGPIGAEHEAGLAEPHGCGGPVANSERHGLQGREQAGAAAGAARGGSAVADGDGDGVRHRPERNEGRGPRVRGEGSAEPLHDREALAHGHGHGRVGVEASRLHADGAQRDHALGRHRFPPLRGDAAGWAEYVAGGGPEPAVRRGAHGLSGGLDGPALGADDATSAERLTALGNAIVPQCAEVVWRIVAEALGWAESAEPAE